MADARLGEHAWIPTWNIIQAMLCVPWTRCNLRGIDSLGTRTHTPGVIAIVVRTRPADVQPVPRGAKNVIFMVSDDARPEMPSYG